MNLNVLNKTRRISSITNFCCNKRVNILVRISSFAKRVRFQCKLHNQLLYSRDKNLVEINSKKLLNDDTDYYKITNFIIEDLVIKSSFLSDHDSILILDILSRIKRPLERICSKSSNLQNSNESEHLEDKNSLYGPISRIISRGQKSLVNQLIQSEENLTLTDSNRYYLIIALSRDCGLVSFSTWLKLFENVNQVLLTKSIDSIYGYKPFQIANMLLIYDQISRWSYKRQNIVNQENTINNIDSNQIEETKLVEKNNQVDKVKMELIIKEKERKKCNPFNLDLITTAIYRIEKCVHELKPEKILKILYLASSREKYSNRLFQNAIVHLESQNLLKLLEFPQLHTLFKLLSEAYTFHLLRHIESFIYHNNVTQEGLRFLKGEEYNLPDRGLFLGNLYENSTDMTHSSSGNPDDEVCRFNNSESLFLSTMVASLEYLSRFSSINKSIFSEIGDISQGILNIFGESHEWRDILGFLEVRLSRVEDPSTHLDPPPDQVSLFLHKLDIFIKLNKITLKLFKNDPKYHSRIRRVEFFMGFITALRSQVSGSLGLDDLNRNMDSFYRIDLNISNLTELKELNSL